jgi:hypothetical protein
MVRFARLIHRRVRDLGGPAVRAAYGGNLSLPWLPPRVVPGSIAFHDGKQANARCRPRPGYPTWPTGLPWTGLRRAH